MIAFNNVIAAGTRLGQGWDKVGTRPGHGWDKEGHRCILRIIMCALHRILHQTFSAPPRGAFDSYKLLWPVILPQASVSFTKVMPLRTNSFNTTSSSTLQQQKYVNTFSYPTATPPPSP